MAFTQKESDLSVDMFAKHLPTNIKKITLYYGLYCFIFVLVNLILISVFSFFHFLLEHDMNTIENWINRNTWEILSIGKCTALVATAKITKLNFMDEIRYRSLIIDSLKRPTIKIWGVVFFLLFIFYAFITQFGGGVVSGQFKEELFYSSYIGSFFFYICDFFILYLLLQVFEVDKKQRYKVLYISLLFFIFTSKMALPYLSKYYIFLMVHFIMLFIFANQNQVTDSAIYALFVIGPLSSLYGIDIVWDNAYSLFSYQKSLPVLGILGIWGLAFGYYHLSRVD